MLMRPTLDFELRTSTCYFLRMEKKGSIASAMIPAALESLNGLKYISI